MMLSAFDELLEEVMQDDAHIITTDEWWAGNEVIRLQKEGQGKIKAKKMLPT